MIDAQEALRPVDSSDPAADLTRSIEKINQLQTDFNQISAEITGIASDAQALIVKTGALEGSITTAITKTFGEMFTKGILPPSTTENRGVLSPIVIDTNTLDVIESLNLNNNQRTQAQAVQQQAQAQAVRQQRAAVQTPTQNAAQNAGAGLSADITAVSQTFNTFISSFSSTFDKVATTISNLSSSLESLSERFGFFEMQHTVTVDGQINLPGIDGEAIAQQITDSIGGFIVEKVKNALDNPEIRP